MKKRLRSYIYICYSLKNFDNEKDLMILSYYIFLQVLFGKDQWQWKIEP